MAKIGVDAAQIGPTWFVSAEIKKKKKKKGAKRTIWLNLNTQTPSDPHTSSKTPKPANSLIVLLIIFYFVLVSNLWVVL